MKKSLTFLFGALLTCAAGCTGNVPAGTFVLDGTVENGGENTTLYLVSGHDVDTLNVVDGKFSFADSLKAPVEERYLSAIYPISYSERNFASFYLEEGRLTLVISSVDSLAKAKLTGSATQAEMDEYNALVEPYYEPLTKLNQDYYVVRDAGDKEKLAQIEKEMDELGKAYREVEGKWISEHPLSYYAFESKSHEMGRMSFEEVDSLFNAIPEKFVGTSVYKRIQKERDNLMKSAPGAVAPDFSDKDINGEEFTLSSLKGHYIILDFWASWCGSCRASMPHVLAAYEKYKDKGLEVVCVADDDHSADKWKAAVEKDGTQAFHHVLRGLKRTANGEYDRSEDKSDDYAVHYLPTKYLIGPDFKIVGRIDEEEVMDAKLQEAFGF